MTEVSNIPEGMPVAHMRLPNAVNLVRALGLIFNNMNIYSQDHSVTMQSIENCYTMLISDFEHAEEVAFIVSEDELRVNQEVIPVNALVKAFVTHLLDREIKNFTLIKGMSREKFGDMVEVICASPEEVRQIGGFAEAITSCALENVRSVKIVFQQIKEDEVVVAKDVLEAAGEGAKGESIVSFLQGEGSANDPEAIGNMMEVASDPNKFSDLIMDAAEAKHEAEPDEDAENMAGLVVGCLKRAYDGLSQDKSLQTKKGQKSLTKALKILEDELLEKLKAVEEQLEDEDVTYLHESVEEMVDELAIEGLAAEYMKKRAAIESNEARLMRFIKKKGLDRIEDFDLQGKLADGGLSMDGWQDLLVKSGLAAEGGGFEALGNLAKLLTSMEDTVTSGAGGTGDGTGDGTGSGDGIGDGTGTGIGDGTGSGGHDENVVGVMTEVDKEIKRMVSKTEQKIQKLLNDIHADEEAEKEEVETGKKPKEKKLTRAKLLEVMAEIVQELCQPLAVINCSVNMMLSKNLGDISDGQEDMLKLASESGDKMKQLTDKLMEISGVPDGMSPDTVITGSLYE